MNTVFITDGLTHWFVDSKNNIYCQSIILTCLKAEHTGSVSIIQPVFSPPGSGGPLKPELSVACFIQILTKVKHVLR